MGVEGSQFGQWRNAKTVGFTRVVSVMRAGRACVIIFPESIAKGSSGKSLEHGHFDTYTYTLTLPPHSHYIH